MKCGLCHQEVEGSFTNIYVIYTCHGCQLPKFTTQYRLVYGGAKEITTLIATSLFIDEYYVSWHYYQNGPSQTHIYKGPIGHLNGDADLEPMTWEWNDPVITFEELIKLPLDDLELLKYKLKAYTLFS